MYQLVLVVIFISTFSACTHHQAKIAEDHPSTNTITDQSIIKDSIDRYGLSECVKPIHEELNGSFRKAVDSLWQILTTNDRENQFPIVYSKSHFKAALLANNFKVDSSDRWIIATKRGFNERWRTDWDKDSNYVELVVTRWYDGNTYDWMIGSDKFIK